MTTLTTAAAGNWRRIRRWATPPAMIRAATDARLAGDWRAACAAANVDVELDDDQAKLFEDDLAHFAPDLLRWHLPRKPARGDTHLDARQVFHLLGDGPSLYIGGTRLGFGSQRLRLFATAEPLDTDAWEDWEWDDGPRPFHALHDYRALRHLFDARESRSLLDGCGWTHLPFHDPAGRPLPESAWGATERILALHDAGRFLEAWQAAGADVPEPPQDEHRWLTRILGRLWTGFLGEHTAVLNAARARGTDQVGLTFGWNHVLKLTGFDRPRLTGEWLSTGYRERDEDWHLDTGPYERPIDADLVRLGAVPVSWLHPLVHAAFFPEAEPSGGKSRTPRTEARLRCRDGAWHQVRMTGGRLDIPHTDEERRREQALLALGGQVHGCLAAEQAWRDGRARLPRALRELRADLMLRAQHGDLPGVLELLDAGVDPHARDAHGRTLLHHISGLMAAPDDLTLLHRLIDAGLDVHARDRRGMTPLQTAAYDTGSLDLVRALIAAGADLDGEDDNGVSVVETMDRFGRPELKTLLHDR
ncbi:ankyrin repeat domain-containing protein [Dactylosporangium sp. NPDC005555]|uniref:ankyrin repeat domain-containing protein n=1 Tax=Dactylosporangium sp. NPDC005555 TaxID=3154889 RepID=UPI0033B57159